MQIWKQVWEADYPADSPSFAFRQVFTSCEMFFGLFAVCFRSRRVGSRNATPEEYADAVVISPLVDAIFWLACTWGLLYIDFRFPNIRVGVDDAGAIVSVHLVDYDDMVILPARPSCHRRLFGVMEDNAHLQNILVKNSAFRQVCTERVNACVCPECSTLRQGLDSLSIQENETKQT